ncbi:hypothetical protein, partial [Lamprobacter modestohalophilus]|uniref:hypothetical protein n=1 Tax=Lamprobacter modestohalophilus TaxID=1064514 RepID=UPI001A920D14
SPVIPAGKPESRAGKATSQQTPKLSRLLPAHHPWPRSRLPGRHDGGMSRDGGGMNRHDGFLNAVVIVNRDWTQELILA